MSTHVYLLATPFSGHGISHMMQDLGRKYVYVLAINQTYRRMGAFWEGRYKASPIDSEAYRVAGGKDGRARVEEPIRRHSVDVMRKLGKARRRDVY